MSATEETNTRAQTNGAGSRPAAATDSTNLSFMKVLGRIADLAPEEGQGDAIHCMVELVAMYDKALLLIETFDSFGTWQDTQGPLEVMLNLRTTAAATDYMNNVCRSVGVPFYDEEWVETYWIPMSRLLPTIPQDRSMQSVAIGAAMSMFLKVDMAQLSSHCKAEILRVLKELLDFPSLSAQRANEIVNLTMSKVLFDDSPQIVESRATRRATAKLVLKSNIIGPLLNFLVSKPLDNERGNEALVCARKDVKCDICYLLSLVLLTLLGEMNPEVAGKHASSIKSAIDSASPHLWGALEQLGEERIKILEVSGVDDGCSSSINEVMRFKAVTAAFQCLTVFSSGDAEKQHSSSKMESLEYTLSRLNFPHLGPDAEDHKLAVAAINENFNEKIPLTENGRMFFGLLTEVIRIALDSILHESSKRILTLGGETSDYPMDLTVAFNENVTNEDMQEVRKKVLDDQKSRGLINDENKSAVKEPGGAGSSAGIKCAVCWEEQISGSNLKLMRCAGCKSVYYCSVYCQTNHWGEHKKFCKRRQAENKK